MSGAKYVIYSREHNAWWGPPPGSGYRVLEEEAGRYDHEAARRICERNDKRGGDSGDGRAEFMYLAPECDVLPVLLEAAGKVTDGYSDSDGGWDSTSDLLKDVADSTKDSLTRRGLRAAARNLTALTAAVVLARDPSAIPPATPETKSGVAK